MSTVRLAATDSMTMLRRRLRHLQRYPSLTTFLIGQPIVFLLLFVYVFGGTLGAGIAGASAGRAEYLEYIVPAILVITVASVALGTAIAVASDMTEGIVPRFRTMDIARSSVLTGHVLGAFVQTVLAVAVTTAVSLLLGFDPTTRAASWLGAVGLLAAFTVALTWLTVALGLNAKSVETASNQPMLLVLLPFLGSGFVPTDSMPSWLRWFAEHQPFTPVIETLRGLLTDGPVGGDGVAALAWCAGLALVGVWWSIGLYRRERNR
jgi:ABC-2 type transport system permease protein